MWSSGVKEEILRCPEFWKIVSRPPSRFFCARRAAREKEKEEREKKREGKKKERQKEEGRNPTFLFVFFLLCFPFFLFSFFSPFFFLWVPLGHFVQGARSAVEAHPKFTGKRHFWNSTLFFPDGCSSSKIDVFIDFPRFFRCFLHFFSFSKFS